MRWMVPAAAAPVNRDGSSSKCVCISADLGRSSMALALGTCPSCGAEKACCCGNLTRLVNLTVARTVRITVPSFGLGRTSLCSVLCVCTAALSGFSGASAVRELVAGPSVTLAALSLDSFRASPCDSTCSCRDSVALLSALSAFLFDRCARSQDSWES